MGELPVLRLTRAQLRQSQTQTWLSPASQAEVITAALDDETDSEPFLPFAGSLLPALIALRKTHQTIQESRAYLASQSSEEDREKRQLDADRASLKDQNLLTDALSARISSLRQELETSAEMRPEDAAKERLDELRHRKRNYDRDTSKLMKSLNGFIDSQLAPMLAAEDLGGPVVGDMMELDVDDLAAGFSSQGKPKKVKDTGAQQDKRQRRIDEIWGDAGDEQAGRDDEATAAGVEMKQLTEELLNSLMEAQGNNEAAFLQLPRESAAARFLVRSKVAQFHPKDASRLRLIDFGRDLEE